MKNIYLIIFILISAFCFAQDNLNFDKKFTQSEDKWVAFPADSTGSHSFGFIYIDAEAGLTLEYQGSFTIDDDGKFVLKKKEMEGSMKYRLEPNNVLVAVIPNSHFDELEISEFPDWLKHYKEDENTIERLYKWGYTYNGWGECEKALEFLKKAEAINADFKGLRVELGFSYNCLKDHQKAIVVLKEAVKSDPNDAYANKELLYSQIHNNQFNDAILTYERIIRDVSDKTYNAENAFNILGVYYQQKDVKKFNEWIEKTGVDKDERIGPYVEQLKKTLVN